MKKFLTILIMTFISVTAFSQTLSFTTTHFSHKEYNSYYGWGNWSSWENSNMLLTIDLTNDIVTVYSPNIQRYKVYAVGNFYYESNAQVQEYKFIDQDGDSGTLKLVMRTTGRSEVYIQFANIIWAYIVVRN